MNNLWEILDIILRAKSFSVGDRAQIGGANHTFEFVDYMYARASQLLPSLCSFEWARSSDNFAQALAHRRSFT
jgi:hypothetical protein